MELRVCGRLGMWVLILLGSLPLVGCQTFDPTDWVTRQELHEIIELRVRYENARSFWAVRHFEAGHAAKQKAQMAEAYRHLQAATRMRPDWDLPYLELATLHPIWDHDRKAELDALTQAVALNPTNPRSHLMLGSVLIAQNRPEEAEQHLKEALLLRSSLDEARLRLANLYQDTDRPAQAAEQYEHLLAAQPDNVALHGVLGELYEQLGKLEQAETHLLALCRYFPRLPRAFLQLAAFYQRQGRIDEAQQALERARQLSPGEERRRRMRPLLPSRR